MAKVPLWGARQQGMQNPGSFPWCRLDLIEVGFQALLLDGMDRRNNWWIFVGEGEKGSQEQCWQEEACGRAWVMLEDDLSRYL